MTKQYAKYGAYLSMFLIFFIFLMAFECNVELELEGKAKTHDVVLMLYLSGDNKHEEDIVRIVNKVESSEIVRSLKVVMLIDRAKGHYSGLEDWSDTRAYEAIYDARGSVLIKSRRIALDSLGITTNNVVELNMGSQYTLADFVSEVKKKYGDAQTKYALMMAGGHENWHSLGVDEGNEKNALEIREIADALVDSGGVDYLIVDSLPLSMALWQVVSRVAGVVVASTEYKSPSSVQWNFDAMLRSMASNVNNRKAVAEGIVDSYGGTELMAVYGSEVQGVTEALEKYKQAVNAEMTTDAFLNDYVSQVKKTPVYVEPG